MPDAWAYKHRLEVRFRDCDAMGHVNHAVYFTYYEQCRFVRALASYGWWFRLAWSGNHSGACRVRLPGAGVHQRRDRSRAEDRRRRTVQLYVPLPDRECQHRPAPCRWQDGERGLRLHIGESLSDSRHHAAPARTSERRTMVVIYGKNSCPYTQAAPDDYARRGI